MISRSDYARAKALPSSVLFAGDDSNGRVVEIFSRNQRLIGELNFAGAEVESPAKSQTKVDEPASVEEDDGATLEASAREVARAEGYEEARREFGELSALRLEEERRRFDRMRVEFAHDRQRFFAAAESQVVQLALAVARKILARDADTGGLPLRATVKAALARVQDGSSTTLRVPLDEQDAWLEMFPHTASAGGTPGAVNVVVDSTMGKGDCVLDTSLGRVELGVSVQMEEVERGFRELMQNQEGE